MVVALPGSARADCSARLGTASQRGKPQTGRVAVQVVQRWILARQDEIFFSLEVR